MIKTADFIHPEDAAALNTLKAIPGFATIMKTIIKYYDEIQFYGTNIASSIRLSPLQLPQIYRHLPPICERLGIEEPEFYLTMTPIPNAWTFGDTKIFITVTSGLIDIMDSEELNAILAHECGHILCRHTLYKSMARILLGQLINTNVIKDCDNMLAIAFNYWSRKAELSCDRVASLITSPDVVSRTMARLAGGGKNITSNINMEEWAKQADIYDKIYKDSNLWEKSIFISNTMNLDHPFTAVRVREILKWGETPEYYYAKNKLNTITKTRCKVCGKPYNPNHKYCTYCGNEL